MDTYLTINAHKRIDFYDKNVIVQSLDTICCSECKGTKNILNDQIPDKESFIPKHYLTLREY